MNTSQQRSNGSRWGTIGGLLITIGFFTPWVRACGQDMSGYDLASSKGILENPEMFWLVLLVGLFNLVLVIIKTDNALLRFLTAILRLGSGLVGCLPFLFLWVTTDIPFQELDYRVGGYLTGIGYLGVLLSFFVEMVTPKESDSSRPLPERKIDHSSPPSSIPLTDYKPPPTLPIPISQQSQGRTSQEPGKTIVRFCGQCGTKQPEEAVYCINCGHRIKPELLA